MKSLLRAGLLTSLFFLTGFALAEGGSSGGGGYDGKNSEFLLNRVKNQLADAILSSSPSIWQKSLAKDWTVKRLANLIRETRYEPLRTKVRDDHNLILDYGWDNNDPNRPYLVAIDRFFTVYEIKDLDIEEKRTSDIAKVHQNYLNDMMAIEKKLLHEAAHLMGMKEDRADQFAEEAILALYRDMIHCQFEVQPGEEDFIGKTANSTGHFSFNRAYGRGINMREDIDWSKRVMEEGDRGYHYMNYPWVMELETSPSGDGTKQSFVILPGHGPITLAKFKQNIKKAKSLNLKLTINKIAPRSFSGTMDYLEYPIITQSSARGETATTFNGVILDLEHGIRKKRTIYCESNYE